MRDGLNRCWNQAGVGGDASCERLAAIGHCRNCEEYSRAGRSLLDRPAPDAVREDWSRLLAAPKPARDSRGESYVMFQVCGEFLALRAVLLERVTGSRPLHTVPLRSNAVFTGIINMDGDLLPCFSAAAALELGEGNPGSGTGKILILRHGGVRLACTVDRVIGIVRLSAGDLAHAPITLTRNARALTTAVFAAKGKRAGILDGDKLVQRLMESAVS